MELRVSAARGTKRPSSEPDSALWFLTESTMSNLIRDYGWAASDLGPLEQWPTEWLVSLSNMIYTAFPTVLFLGPGMRVIYNDAYLPHMGSKHPRALGQCGDEVWPEIWDTVGSTLRRVLNTGKPSWDADKRLLVNRHGYLEETYWTYSYSCIKERSGSTTGLYAVVEETTSRFLSERRMATAQLFTTHATGINARAQVISALELALRSNRDDIPFALLYLCSNQSEYADAATAQSLLLHVRVRIKEGLQETPLEAFLTGDGCTMQEVQLPEKVAALMESEAGAISPTSVFCIPLLLDTETGKPRKAFALLVIGINPLRAVDEPYRSFVRHMSNALCSSLLTARNIDRERQRAKELEQLGKAKTAFFHNVSHEFRTPLTLTLGPLQEVLEDSNKLSDSHREALQTAMRNGKRLLKLVNSILDFARLEAGRVKAHFRPLDLSALTADLVSNFRSACQRAGITLNVSCPPLGQSVYVDPHMWETIVLNLLSNAFKYTEQGTITVMMERGRNAALLLVKDTGCGIPPAALTHIFDRFYRAPSSGGRTQEGAGIGLALVSELVQLHGGDVQVESTVGHGSSFSIRIPYGKAHLPEDQVNNQPYTAAEAGQPLDLDWWLTSFTEERPETTSSRQELAASFRVLIADDNADMRNHLSRILQGAGYNVTTAKDGVDAMEKFTASGQRFDLVISDLMMPNMDGEQLLKGIRKACGDLRHVPVIFVSARAGEEEKADGLLLGADDYLVKPFSGRELLAHVAARLGTTLRVLPTVVRGSPAERT